MLHIIWGMLKITGIILLVAILLLVLLLLSVLLVPIRYQANGYKEQEEAYAQGKVSWLFHLISARVRYEKNSGLQWSVRIFGISTDSFLAFIEKLKKEKTEKESENAQLVATQQEEKKEEDTSGKSVTQALQDPKKEVSASDKMEHEADTKQNEGFGDKLRGAMRKVLSVPEKVKHAIQNAVLKVKTICDKIKSLHTFIKGEEFQGAVAASFTECKGILLHIRPRKIKGYVRFGFEDPSLTGQLLGILSICYPWYHRTLQIYPHFDRKIWEGDCMVKGRICIGRLALTALRLYRNKNIKTVIKQFTN